MKITRSIFESQRQRRFGAANPERMQLAFWEWMIRGEESPPADDGSILGRFGLIKRRGILKSSYGPYRARDLFKVPLNREDGPIWTFDRMGATRTELPDGRVVCVGGEHEDSYDPDFCIYNDVVALDLDGSIEIYGYPRDVFPPTDFHTATLIGDRVLVIGRLGYPEERHPGTTPVFALDLAGFCIEALLSNGEPPGWVFGHEAEFSHGIVTIRGGEVYEEKGGEERIRRNFDDFAYEVGTGLWTRLTKRNWRQFSISDQGRKAFMRGPRFRGCGSPDDEPWKGMEESEEDPFVYVMPEALLPRSFPYETIWSDEPSPEDRILIAGVPVSIKMGPFTIEIVVEGEMDEAMANQLAEDIREGVEADTGLRCILKTYD